MSLVRLETRETVALLTLDDPGRRNAVSLPMAEEIAAVLGELETRDDLRALVVTGAPPAFSAGADLSDLERASRERLERIYEGFLAVARFPLPTIAAVNGPAVGAGLNLALACDVRLAGRAARFESRFLDLALHPGGGHTWMLRNLLGPQGAVAVALLGEPLDGEEAARRGLAWRCVDDDALVEEAVSLAGRVSRAPLEMLRRLKRTLRERGAVDDHEPAVARELEGQLWSTEQPEFRERLAALRARIARGRGRS
jgi:enoyl-CoA hydratase